jgi:hypothetical protein
MNAETKSIEANAVGEPVVGELPTTPPPSAPVSGSEDELILMTSEFSQKSCPFCATKGLEVDYSSFGTDLYCADGCHGHFIFPCAPFEALEMWERNTQNTEVSQREADVETSQ